MHLSYRTGCGGSCMACRTSLHIENQYLEAGIRSFWRESVRSTPMWPCWPRISHFHRSTLGEASLFKYRRLRWSVLIVNLNHEEGNENFLMVCWIAKHSCSNVDHLSSAPCGDLDKDPMGYSVPSSPCWKRYYPMPPLQALVCTNTGMVLSWKNNRGQLPTASRSLMNACLASGLASHGICFVPVNLAITSRRGRSISAIFLTCRL